MVRLGALLCFAACGRVDFSARDLPCSPGSIAPDPVTIAGTAYEFTSFDDTTQPVPDVVVTVMDPVSTAILAQATTDSSGKYSVSFPTGGSPRMIASRFARGGYLTSTEVPMLPIDRNETVAESVLWSIGDGPLWSDGSIDSVYAAAGVTRDQSRGNLNVAIIDCAGNPIVGAIVTMDPSPEALEYLAPDGPPTPGLTSTVAPFTWAVAFNAQPGSTRISVQAPQTTFLDQTVDIVAGEYVTLTVAQPAE